MTGGWSLLPRKRDRQTGRFVRACLAEIFGTFSLIFWGCGTWGQGDESTILNKSFSFGIAAATTIHIFSDISGAHMNPAVSIAMFIAQKISLVRCLFYCCMQFLGGFLASGVLYGLNGSMPGMIEFRKQPEVSNGIGFVWELLGTLMLIYLILATTNDYRERRESSYDYPLSVGFCYFLIHLVMVPYTGCAINPVRAVAPNVIGAEVPGHIWVYLCAHLLAALIGALSYLVIFANQYKYNVPFRSPSYTSSRADIVFGNHVAVGNGK